MDEDAFSKALRDHLRVVEALQYFKWFKRDLNPLDVLHACKILREGNLPIKRSWLKYEKWAAAQVKGRRLRSVALRDLQFLWLLAEMSGSTDGTLPSRLKFGLLKEAARKFGVSYPSAKLIVKRGYRDL